MLQRILPFSSAVALFQFNKSSEKSFVFGSNEFGVLNPNSKKKQFLIPSHIVFPFFKLIKLSYTFGAGIDTNDKLIVWGSLAGIKLFDAQLDFTLQTNNEISSFTQLTDMQFTNIAVSQDAVLGISNKQLHLVKLDGTHSEISLPNAAIPLQIDCGDHHGCVLTTDGVFTFPMDDFPIKYGQCAELIEKLEIANPEHLACGSDHTMITASNSLFAIGCNIHGQCGYAPKPSLPLSQISTPGPVDRIYSRGNTSYMISNNASYSCGFGQYGELGNGKYSKMQPNWQKLTKISNLTQYSEVQNKLVDLTIKDILCGKYHTMVEFDSDAHNKNEEFYGNDVLGFGLNKDGQIGNGKKGIVAVPTRIVQSKTETDKTCLKIFKTPLRTQRISCGFNATIIYTDK